MFKYFIFILSIFLMFGCVPQPIAPVAKEKIKVKEYSVQQPKKQKVFYRKKGALYSRQGPSLFADKKDLQIGDIIQIKINESLKASSKGSRKLKKNNNLDISGGDLKAPPPPPPKIDENGKEIPQEVIEPPVIQQLRQLLGYEFNSQNSLNFAGDVNSKYDEKFKSYWWTCFLSTCTFRASSSRCKS
jgi:flagellar L-ring protein precursor FlgH